SAALRSHASASGQSSSESHSGRHCSRSLTAEASSVKRLLKQPNSAFEPGSPPQTMVSGCTLHCTVHMPYGRSALMPRQTPPAHSGTSAAGSHFAPKGLPSRAFGTHIPHAASHASLPLQSSSVAQSGKHKPNWNERSSTVVTSVSSGAQLNVASPSHLSVLSPNGHACKQYAA